MNNWQGTGLSIGLPPKVVKCGIHYSILTKEDCDVFGQIKWGSVIYKGPWGPEPLLIDKNGFGLIQTNDWERQIECLEIYGKELDKTETPFPDRFVGISS